MLDRLRPDGILEPTSRLLQRPGLALMLNTRARGLANLHVLVTTAIVGIFFWGYAQVIYHVPYVRLSHEVNLIPYFLCAVGGMLLASGDVTRLIAQSPFVDLPSAASLAARQVGLVALLTFTMMFATQDHDISRAFLGSFLVLSWVGCLWANFKLPQALARSLFQGEQRARTLIIGRIAAAYQMRGWIQTNAGLGTHVVGFVTDEPPGSAPPDLPAPILGTSADVERLLAELAVAQVVLLEFPATDQAANTIIDRCQEHGCRLLIRNNFEERYIQALLPVREGNHDFFTLQEEPLEDPMNRFVKRAFDLLVALPAVVLLLPFLCALVWILQRRQSPGPLFHARDRRGLQGATFRMLKFRSMHPAAPDATHEAKQAETDDARIFPFGRFLRRTSLDEFPQFVNVLLGHMSVVGPRPYMPLLDEEFRQQLKGYRTRHFIKPGITGLAQSKGLRGAVLEQEMLERRFYWDIHYIGHWSVWLDVQITLLTLVQVLRPPTTAY